MKKGRNQSISKEEGYLRALGGLLRLRVKNTAMHRRMALAPNRDSRRGSAQMKRGGPERELQIPLAVQMNADNAGVKGSCRGLIAGQPRYSRKKPGKSTRATDPFRVFCESR